MATVKFGATVNFGAEKKQSCIDSFWCRLLRVLLLSRGAGAGLRGRRSRDLGRGPRGSIAVKQATTIAAKAPGYRMLEKHVAFPTRHLRALVGFHMRLANDTRDI